MELHLREVLPRELSGSGLRDVASLLQSGSEELLFTATENDASDNSEAADSSSSTDSLNDLSAGFHAAGNKLIEYLSGKDSPFQRFFGEMEHVQKTSPREMPRLREVLPDEPKDEALRDFSTIPGPMPNQFTIIGIDEDADQDEIVNTVLQGHYKLERLIRRDNHATVYSVQAPGITKDHLEARAYTLSGVSKKTLQYRRRNMKRLANRVVYETECKGRTILVYQVDQLGTTKSKAEKNLLKLRLEEEDECGLACEGITAQNSPVSRNIPTDLPNSEVPKPGKSVASNSEKQEHQRQIARMKQQARRARKREEKKSSPEAGVLLEDHKHIEGGETRRNKPSPLERILKFLLTLHHLVYVHDSKVTEPGPGASNEDRTQGASILTMYLRSDFISRAPLNSVHEVEDMLALIQEQIIVLNKQQRNLPRLVYMTEKKIAWLAKGLIAPDETHDLETLEGEMESALNRLYIIINGEDLLADILKVLSRRHKQLEERLASIDWTIRGKNFLYSHLIESEVDEIKEIEQMERNRDFLMHNFSFKEFVSLEQVIRKRLESVGVIRPKQASIS